MEKRVLIAMVLCGAALLLYTKFFYHPQAPTPNPTPVASTPESVPSTQPSSMPSQAAETIPSSAAPQAPQVTNFLENPQVKTELSSAPGLPEHWWLKNYFMEAGKKGPNVDLLSLVGDKSPLRFELFPGQEPLKPFFSVLSQEARDIRYEARVGSLRVQPTVHLEAENYTAQIKLLVENQGSEAKSVAPGLFLLSAQNPESSRGFLIFREAPNLKHPLYRLGNSVKRYDNVKKLGEFQEEAGDIAWAGIEDRYFLRILLARQVTSQNRVRYGIKQNEVFTSLSYPAESLAPGQNKSYEFTVYFGPKDPDLLNAFGGARLDEAIDYGWFGLVAKPILYLLKFFYRFLHNWGLAIIILTIFIKIILQPMTKKSMQSMKAMQQLQPQLQKIREKYKNDREKLNLETMSLFRNHKVNPMGGCLPMVIQMPIYIALYKVLYNATELYHAPFFAFYKDLSAPDPYFILPVLLGIFMVLQQKMSPNMGDPTQARMMMLMPIMFSAFMLFLPLGLVLYIFVNTLMTVVQQYMYQKDISLLGLFRKKT